MTKQSFRIIIGTIALLACYTLLQQGPLFLSKLTQYPIQFVAESPRNFVADLSALPNGKYFVSLGRTLGDTEIYLNGVLLQRGHLTAGVPIELSGGNEPKRVSIVWLAHEEWRKYLFDQPVITGYGVGFLIQEWRKFVSLFMGPISSLALVLFALFNYRVSKGESSQIVPHFICGVSGFVYGLFLAGIPDLFFSFEVNLPYQIALRIVLSGAIIYLISTYAKKSCRTLLALHIVGVGLVIALSFAKQDWLIVLYKAELIFFVFATLIPTIALTRLDEWTAEVELMICLGLSLTVLEAFAGVIYILWGPSSWTVWSPSFIAVLAVSNFFFIYRKAITRSIEVQLSEKQYYLAAQIAHDIRSPLASLNAIAQSTEGMDASVRGQIKNVVARIRDIANNLLSSNPLGDTTSLDEKSLQTNRVGENAYNLSLETSEDQLISQRLSSIVSEKRLQFNSRNDIEIEFNEASMGLPYFVKVQSVELGRVLSNLIDNAVEALGQSGRVTIDLIGSDDQIQIVIEDTGYGMRPDVLSKIGTRGFSYGKDGSDSGSGLGVYHAMETIKSWGGNLKYSSELEKGTKAIISLPRIGAPEWFSNTVCVNKNTKIVVLDDDLSMHQVWKEKLRAAGGSSLQVVTFRSSKELIRWYRNALDVVDRSVFLCDYDLAGDDCTGLDLIEMLGIASNAILVTNGWDDPVVRSRCSKFGVKILPKVTTFSIYLK